LDRDNEYDVWDKGIGPEDCCPVMLTYQYPEGRPVSVRVILYSCGKIAEKFTKYIEPFVALIIIFSYSGSYIMVFIPDFNEREKYFIKDIPMELSKLRLIELSNSEKITTEIPKRVKDILTGLKVSIDDLVIKNPGD